MTDEPKTTDVPVAFRSPRLARAIVFAVVIFIVAATGAVVGRVTGPSTPDDHSIDAGFARDMSVHHSQAVEMAMLVDDRTADPGVKVLASDIALTQQEQIGRMKGWLVSWGLLPTGSRPAMRWMTDADHGGHSGSASALLPDGRMPGMASQTDLDTLRARTGRPAEVLFLQLMVAHHRGGIPMAEHAAGSADTAGVRELARAIAAGQTAEVKVLEKMLRDRGAAPA